jgi:histidine transporter
MMFALGREGYFPKAIAMSHHTRQVPTLAILLTGACMFLGVLLDVVSPSYAYVFLGSLGTIGFMWTWAMIPLSLILYRVKMGAERVAALRWKVPLYPITPVFVIVAVLVAIIAPIFQNSPGLFGLNGGAVPVVAGAIWVAVWVVYFLAIGRRFEHGHEYRARQAAAQDAVAAGVSPYE